MMAKTEDIVRALIRPKAGGASDEVDRRATLGALADYTGSQRQLSRMLIAVLLLLILAPVVLVLANVSEAYLPYLLGADGVFTAGTITLVVNAIQNSNKAHTLALVCQGLESVDA